MKRNYGSLLAVGIVLTALIAVMVTLVFAATVSRYDEGYTKGYYQGQCRVYRDNPQLDPTGYCD